MADLVTFGEMLLRLQAPDFQKIEQTNSFKCYATGGEMNAGVTARRMGINVANVTKLPDNPLGRMIENKTREQGVDVTHTVWTAEGRVGIFYLEMGALPRTSNVVYDRSHSAMCSLKPGEVDWKSVLREAKVLHVSGTAPALSDSCAATVKEAFVAAKECGCEVSVDLNYRAKLWSEEKAGKIMSELMEYIDILITTEEDCERVFKISGNDYDEVATKIQDTFGTKVVVITLRENVTVLRNTWTARAYRDGEVFDDIVYDIELVDRVGGGDAFTGGFLFGYINFVKDLKKAVQYGNAASSLKQTIPGDVNWATREEVDALISRGSASGMKLRIQR